MREIELLKTEILEMQIHLEELIVESKQPPKDVEN